MLDIFVAIILLFVGIILILFFFQLIPTAGRVGLGK